MIRVSIHIKGKKYTVTESSDRYENNFLYAEMLCFKHNIKATLFDYLTSSERVDSYKSGAIDFGIYTYECQSQLIANIATKIDTYISNITTNRGGRVPNVMSYAAGDLSYFNNDVLKNRFIGGRNSFYGNNKVGKFSFRDQKYTDMICRDSTFRWNYYTEITQGPYKDGNQTDGVIALEKHINIVKENNGWFQNFMHWHWNIGENMGLYFSSLDTFIDNDCISANYSDVVEWYWLRNSIDKITRISEFIFNIEYFKNDGINYDLIYVPLYIDVDLRNTSLQGKFIKTTDSNNKIYKRGTDRYTIAVQLDFSIRNKIVSIQESLTDISVVESLPIVSLSGTTLTSDQPIKSVIFRKTKAQTKDKVILLERQNTFSTSKTLPTFNTASYDYYIGFINENGTSGTLEII